MGVQAVTPTCPACDWPVHDCVCVRKAQPIAFCTCDADCHADADQHLENCPVEHQLREEMGF